MARYNGFSWKNEGAKDVVLIEDGGRSFAVDAGHGEKAAHTANRVQDLQAKRHYTAAARLNATIETFPGFVELQVKEGA